MTATTSASPADPGTSPANAKLVLLVSEVDEADDILDDDRPPVRYPYVPRWWVFATIAFLILAGPVALVLHWY